MVFEECICEPPVKDGQPYIPWVGQYIGSCTWTNIEIVSLAFGLSNIGLWLFAQLPQLYENYKRKSVEAVHPLFLIIWLLGDTTNLLGCILTQQLPFQLYTAIYFCIMDVFLLSQWGYYALIYKRSPDEEPLVFGKARSSSFGIYGILIIINMSVISLLFYGRDILFSQMAVNSPSALDSAFTPRMRELLTFRNGTTLPLCQLNVTLLPWEVLIGDISAWMSCVLYLAARVPQIVRNYQRQTTQGLSITMFAIIFAANTFYGISVLMVLKAIDARFYASVLPFLIGSLGTLIPTTIVFGQWFYYDCSYSTKQIQLYNDEEEFIQIKS